MNEICIIFSALISEFYVLAIDPSKSRYQQTSLPDSLTDLESNNGDTIITLGFEIGGGPTKKDKTEQNIRRKQSLANDNSMGSSECYLIYLIMCLVKMKKFI